MAYTVLRDGGAGAKKTKKVSDLHNFFRSRPDSCFLLSLKSAGAPAGNCNYLFGSMQS